MAKKKKKTNAITKVGDKSNIPAHLREYDTMEGMEEVKKKVIIPRMKLIQGQSSKDLRDRFGEGSCVFQPGDVVVCDSDGEFRCVPVFYFVEYVCWADINDKGNDTILERSFDETSELAKKCQNPDTRIEDYKPEGSKKTFKCRNCEVLNFICYISDQKHPLTGEPFVLSFQRGEFINGQNFCSFLKLRKAPIWANIIEFKPAFRERKDYEWYGLDFGNPEDGESFILEEEVEFFRKAHITMKENYANRMLVVDHGEKEEEEEDEGSY